MLDHPEHVRSERVSKWFKRVGRNMSWHNVTILVDYAYGNNKMKMVCQSFKLTKKISIFITSPQKPFPFGVSVFTSWLLLRVISAYSASKNFQI
jgi:hypothetical protein